MIASGDWSFREQYLFCVKITVSYFYLYTDPIFDKPVFRRPLSVKKTAVFLCLHDVVERGIDTSLIVVVARPTNCKGN